ncbi:heat shock 70 kDa protein 12A-like [Mytilus californianus]|uniref:heat shock 70 kDa protein 12A-like n=1 Tax=Mytilus californianus TaxID=6549 RepID=UPI0022473119|nr:heat shock 70 kDa protein 12A-like [Mytilus californianus]XP_052088365.1 heat shock 70 kDa protein 12A-like [Mytilus californianus]
MSSSKLLVVAIDFGTTYSGYAFSSISEKEKVYTYNWSKGITQTPKTPTSILFTPRRDFDSFGYEAEEKYARLSHNNENRNWYFFKRFKLTLHKNQERYKDGKSQQSLNERTTIPDCTNKPMLAIDVFSGGIQYLKEHLFSHFQERLPQLRKDDIHWVLTMPAIWDEPAKKFMRKSAEKAGIPGCQLTLALEPESAALYCQLGVCRSGLTPVQPGAKFLLLDCGGGTVDVTVHEVRHDGSLKEIHRASGGLWGGIKVDDAFQEYLYETFNDKFISLKQDDIIELNKKFESLKKRVDTEDKMYTIQLPVSLIQVARPETLIAGKLKLSSVVVKRFFDQPIRNITEHVKGVLDSLRCHAIETIVLVGGFGESRLLQTELKKAFPRINILTPENPSSAVVEGAVEFGHCPEKIRYRMSPYTYGVSTTSKFLHWKHPISKLLNINGKEYCKDVFDIHVTIDQIVETGSPISNETYVPLYPDQTVLSLPVVSSESKNPIFVDDKGCKIIGRFEITIPNTFSGYQRDVNVKMIFSGTELKVEARSEHSQRVYTSTFSFE